MVVGPVSVVVGLVGDPPTVALAIPAFFGYDTTVAANGQTDRANWQAIVAAGTQVGIVVADTSFPGLEQANPAAVPTVIALWQNLRKNGVAVLGYVNGNGGQYPWDDPSAPQDLKRQVDPWWEVYGEVMSGIYIDVGPVASAANFNEAAVQQNYAAYYTGIRQYYTQVPGYSREDQPWRVMVNASQASFQWLADNSDWQLVWEAGWPAYSNPNSWGYLDQNGNVQTPVPL